MTMAGPIEIYGESHVAFAIRLNGPLTSMCSAVQQPTSLDTASVRESLMRIVPLCLDNDPSLIPISCNTNANDGNANDDDDDRDPDDFRFWSERQAKRISLAVEQAFGVELDPEVIIADANLAALTNRIMISRELLSG